MSNKIDQYEINGFVNDFGRLVKQLRTETRHKQETLSDSIGISTRQLSDIENGKATCRIDTLYKICNAFGLSLADFFLLLKQLD
ncbi:helix-turn-helix domain-containing protein [Acinetobacter pittii]|uniref:helix-turn-helix domain-containing protein n=1 Tax=Acinetobacter pittii TaxID=48296 RepID=UPI001EFE7ECB|nr:helix-turn-helix transcriptional regulator [Acinetobacter pittii]MCG9481148.1 helix-turn-helix domain-containing protein [Acinetobacter pittii]